MNTVIFPSHIIAYIYIKICTAIVKKFGITKSTLTLF